MVGGVSLPGTRGSITQSSQLWAQAGPPDLELDFYSLCYGSPPRVMFCGHAESGSSPDRPPPPPNTIIPACLHPPAPRPRADPWE